MKDLKLQPNIIGSGYFNETLKVKLSESIPGKKYGSKKFFDYFKIKHNMKDKNNQFVDANEVMNELLKKINKAKIEELNEMTIKFASNDINAILRSSFKKYDNKGNVVGKGDGLNWYEFKNNEWVKVDDPGEKSLANYQGKDGWKLNLHLGLMIDGFNNLGTLAILRSTSYHIWKVIKAQLEAFKEITKGQLTEIPFKFRVRRAKHSLGDYAQCSIEYDGGVLDLATKASEIKEKFIALGLDKIQEKIDRKFIQELEAREESGEDVFDEDNEEFMLNQKESIKIDALDDLKKPEQKPNNNDNIVSDFLKANGLNSEDRQKFYIEFSKDKEKMNDDLELLDKNFKTFKKKKITSDIVAILNKKKDMDLFKDFNKVKSGTVEDLEGFYKNICS